jgi:hypothetical protein
VFLIREIMHCRPGKVRPMVDKFLKMSRLNEKAGFGKMRVMTDYAGERYWTIVAEFEIESMDAMEAMMKGEGISPELGKEFEKVMEGYHDLVEWGRREVYRIEGQ